MDRRLQIGVAVAIFLVVPMTGICQQAKPEENPLSQAIMNRLPVDYRDVAGKLVAASSADQESLGKLTDDQLATRMVWYLAQKPEGTMFLLAEFEKEPSPKLRTTMIMALGQYWAAHPDSQKILEEHASTDPDPDVALKALSQLRTLRMQELGKLVEARLDLAKKTSDSSGLAKLAKEQEIHYQWYGELALPSFMRTPPPLFSVLPDSSLRPSTINSQLSTPSDAVRVLAFGDFGVGNEAQKRTAEAMVAYHRNHRFDFGITLGDNFYTYGMDSPSDPRWKSQFEDLYGPMGIKIYAAFGNHDYGQADSPAAEILYSEKSSVWRLPAPYYTFTAGSAQSTINSQLSTGSKSTLDSPPSTAVIQFFAIDTMDLSEAELLWLGDELAKSQAIWKVVYGHYPIYSATGDNKDLVERLLPVLKKGNADVYIAGHHHNLQELKPDGSLHFFISGGGGATLYNVDSKYPRSVFHDKVNGFSVLEADSKQLTFRFIDLDGKELFHETIQKDNPPSSPPPSAVDVPALPVFGFLPSCPGSFPSCEGCAPFYWFCHL